MAVNSITNLYQGGMRPTNGDWTMLPAGSASGTGANAVTGYADHQRLRSYAVTRQMHFTPRVPYGGLNLLSQNDQKDWCWYEDFVAAGSNVAVDDVWNLIIIPPNTRLQYIDAWVFTGLTGVTFTVMQVDTAGAQVGSDQIAGIGATDMTNPSMQLVTANVQNSTSLRFLAIKFTAVPGSSGVAKLQGLDFAVQAEVVDWGSFDFNGNA